MALFQSTNDAFLKKVTKENLYIFGTIITHTTHIWYYENSYPNPWSIQNVGLSIANNVQKTATMI